jgi:hypothetical protein
VHAGGEYGGICRYSGERVGIAGGEGEVVRRRQRKGDGATDASGGTNDQGNKARWYFSNYTRNITSCEAH